MSLEYYVERIKPALETAKGHDLIDPLASLWNLIGVDAIRESLCSQHPEAVSLVIDILLANGDDDPLVRYISMVCLWYLSRNYFAKSIMCSPNSRLLPVAVKYLTAPDNYEDTTGVVENVLTNCMLEQANHNILFDPDLGVLDYFKNEILDPDPLNPDAPFQTCNFMLYRIKNETIHLLLKARIPEIIVNKLFSFGNDFGRWEVSDYVHYWCLNFVLTLSAYPLGQKVLQDQNIDLFLLPILSDKSVEGMKAIFIFLNCYSSSSSSSSGSCATDCERPPGKVQTILQNILSDYPFLMKKVFQLFQFTLNLDSVPPIPSVFDIPVYHGVFTLRDITSFYKNLSFEHQNYSSLMKFSHGLCVCFQRMIQSFHRNDREFSAPGEIAATRAGGGGQDELSIQNILEFLIQISLHRAAAVIAEGEGQLAVENGYRITGAEKKKLRETIVMAISLPEEVEITNRENCENRIISRETLALVMALKSVAGNNLVY
jgi:hypothetical protein